MTRHLTALSCAGALLLAGCDYFPEELLDGSAGDAAPDAGTFELAETCLRPSLVPMVTENLEDVHIDLTGLSDDVNVTAICTGADAPGNDGFFGVTMEEGEKWHFHLRTTSSEMFNPAIYVLDSSCDSRSCTARGIDECGAGRDEHLSFVAPLAGIYYVGIDSRVPGGASYQLVAVRPICGNGSLEHSETCDDGNMDDGDGCDSVCRKELSTGMSEQEPNDDPTGANRLFATTGAVNGQIGGRCDRDLYLFELSEPAAVEVSLSALGGLPCASDTPVLDLNLLSANGTSVLLRGTTTTGEFCPAISSGMLAAGTYYVSISASESSRLTDYALTVSRL